MFLVFSLLACIYGIKPRQLCLVQFLLRGFVCIQISPPGGSDDTLVVFPGLVFGLVVWAAYAGTRLVKETDLYSRRSDTLRGIFAPVLTG